MTPFLVYLLMQADNIIGIIGFLATMFGIAFFILCLFTVAASHSVDEHDIENKSRDWRTWETFRVLRNKAAIFFFPCVLITTFMPSTKTIAAMIVLPQVTSPEAIHRIGKEGNEILQLAKDALRNLGSRGQPKPEKQP